MEWMKIDEMASRYGVSKLTIYNWVREGRVERKRSDHVSLFRIAGGYSEESKLTIIKETEC